MPWLPYFDLHPDEGSLRRKRLLRKTRFYADHNIRAGLVEALRAQGVDVVTAGEVRKSTASDHEQLAIAKRLHRILLTHDRDFLNKRRFSTRLGTGIIVLDGGDGSLMNLVEVFRFLLLTKRGHEYWTTTIMEIKLDGTVTCRWWDKSVGRDLETRYRLAGQQLMEWVADTKLA
jgi:predicted nuclease of predicted toxin-antitoxin system